MTSRLPRSTILKWALGGVVFGLLFPLFGAMLAGGGLIRAHQTQPVLYVVDLAPLVLGLAGAVIGVRTARLELYGFDAEALADKRLVEVEAANRQLVELLDSRSDCIGRIVEELRLPLTVIEALVDDLRTSPSAALGDTPELLEIETEQLGRIVDDLWVAAQGGSRDLTTNPERFELSGLVSDIHASLRRHLQSEPVLDLAPVPVYADPYRVRQIARNLMVNADEHGGAHVSIRTLIHDGQAVLEVRDDGDPLPAAERAVMFEPYATLDGPKPGNGIGLGLTVARSLARRMGGDLTYDHFEGWAIFRVRLPMAPPTLDFRRVEQPADERQESAPTKPIWRHAS